MSNRGRAGAHQHQGCPSSGGGNSAESRKTLPTDANTTPTTTPQRLDGASTRQRSGGDKSAMWGATCEGGGSNTTADDAAVRGAGGAAPTRGASWRGADKAESERRVGKKRTRVEGRGSSAAQRAAANEACKGITLEALQAQYYRPLSDVAKDLGVSVARLLKKCREFGILRWPYRHVRSVQESIEQLEKDKEAATDEVATDELEHRLKLHRRRGELVVHFASCGLESEMRKRIFMEDPRDVDSMLDNAHEVHGGGKIPPPGWESLGRFPDAAVREHFLQQMRASMVGGGASALSPPDSPHAATNVYDDSASSLEDSSRDVLHHHHQQQKLQSQHLQGYRGVAPHHSRPEGQWQQQPPPPQSHAYPRQGPHHYQQPAWQGRQVYSRGVGPDMGAHPALPAPYWPGLHGAAEMPEAIAGVGRGIEATELGRLRSSPGRVDVPSSVSLPHAGVYLPTSAASWPAGPPPTGSATGLSGHQEGGRNSSLSPLLRPRFAGPPGSGSSIGGVGYSVGGGGGGREPQVPANPWGGGPLGPAGESAAAAPGGAGNHGGTLRDEWRPSERMAPQTPPTPSHLGGPRRPWDSGDLINPAGRGRVPPSGGAGALPSIFDRHGRGHGGGLDQPPAMFFSGTGVTSSAAAAAPAGSAGGLTTSESRQQSLGGAAETAGMSRDAPGWARGFHETPIGPYGHRWSSSAMPPTQQQQQQQQGHAFGSPVAAFRWQDRPATETTESASSGPSVGTQPAGSDSRSDAPWTSGSRAGGFDEGKEEARMRAGSWPHDSSQQQQQQGGREDSSRGNPEQSSHGPYF